MIQEISLGGGIWNLAASFRKGTCGTCGGMERVGTHKLKDLNADLLAEVFSFLSSQEFCEVMSVSKHWKRSAKEGTGLCRHVKVYYREEMVCGEEGHKFMCKMLAAARRWNSWTGDITA